MSILYFRKSSILIIIIPHSFDNRSKSSLRAISPLSITISEIAATFIFPVSLHKSTDASVCPTLPNTPFGFARSGNMWPGRVNTDEVVAVDKFTSVDARS